MGIGSADAIKAGGVVYTPVWLADLVIHQAPASALFAGLCADISCGEGAFLLRLCQRVWDELGKSAKGAARVAAFEAWAGSKLWGSDVDKTALKKAKQALDGFAASVGAQEIKWRLKEMDALSPKLRSQLGGKCSLMVGNPPYVRIQHLSEASRAEAQKLSFCAKGSTDLYLAFYEIGLACLAPKGYLSFVAPNSWTRARAGAAMRASLAKSGQLTRLIDFKDYPPFDNVGAYCAVALMEQAGGRKSFEYLEWDREKRKTISIGMAPCAGLDSALPMPAVLARAGKSAVGMVELGRLCRFSVGFATLADEVFITGPMDLSKLPGSGPVECEFASGKAWIEREALRPLIKASIAKLPKARADRLILFPYAADPAAPNATPQALDEARMKALYPLAAAYLSSRKDRLQARDRGKENPKGWMAFGRSQGLVSAFEAWVISPMLAKEPAFCRVEQTPGWAASAFVAGLGIRFDAPESSRKKLLGVLNSQEMDEFVKQAGADYRGGYKSYAKTVIERFPVDPKAIGVEWFETRAAALAWLKANLPKKALPKALGKAASPADIKRWESETLVAGKALFKEALAFGFEM